MQKKMFKVLNAVTKKDGGTYWMRIGSGFTNKDDSINVHLDAMPKDFKLQLRAMDEADLRPREPRRDGEPMPPLHAPPTAPNPDQIPF